MKWIPSWFLVLLAHWRASKIAALTCARLNERDRHAMDVMRKQSSAPRTDTGTGS